MLSNFHSLKYGTFGFRFKESHQQRIVGIYSLGWEKQMSILLYDWDGLSRSEKDIIIFQYTLKGHGEIRINDIHIVLKPAMPSLSKFLAIIAIIYLQIVHEWEFIHLTLFGEEGHQML